MRFTAPEHATGVMLSTGPVDVVDGILEVPDDTPTSDLGGLSVNGFVLAPDVAAESAPARSAPLAPPVQPITPASDA